MGLFYFIFNFGGGGWLETIDFDRQVSVNVRTEAGWQLMPTGPLLWSTLSYGVLDWLTGYGVDMAFLTRGL